MRCVGVASDKADSDAPDRRLRVGSRAACCRRRWMICAPSIRRYRDTSWRLGERALWVGMCVTRAALTASAPRLSGAIGRLRGASFGSRAGLLVLPPARHGGAGMTGGYCGMSGGGNWNVRSASADFTPGMSASSATTSGFARPVITPSAVRTWGVRSPARVALRTMRSRSPSAWSSTRRVTPTVFLEDRFR